jgi:hypothetical protein
MPQRGTRMVNEVGNVAKMTQSCGTHLKGDERGFQRLFQSPLFLLVYNPAIQFFDELLQLR